MVPLILRLSVLLLAASLGACAARGGPAPVPRPFPGASLPPVDVPAEAGGGGGEPASPGDRAEDGIDGGQGVVATALGYRGVPYRFGGADPAGFDCSGFVQYVFRKAGALLPREVRDQFHVGREVGRDEVQAGDLVFFQTVSRGASHVGLALGDGQFIHAPSSRGVVRVERLASSYWAPRFVGARRVEAAGTTTD